MRSMEYWEQLENVAAFLEKYGEHAWAKVFAHAATGTRAGKDMKAWLNHRWGHGMGSLAELRLSAAAGHNVAKADEDAVNRELQDLIMTVWYPMQHDRKSRHE